MEIYRSIRGNRISGRTLFAECCHLPGSLKLPRLQKYLLLIVINLISCLFSQREGEGSFCTRSSRSVLLIIELKLTSSLLAGRVKSRQVCVSIGPYELFPAASSALTFFLFSFFFLFPFLQFLFNLLIYCTRSRSVEE